MRNLEDYFKYYPPTTQKRKDLHDKANNLSLAFCQKLLKAENNTTVNTDCSQFLEELKLLTNNPVCQRWLDTLIVSIIDAAFSRDEESILMHVQQARMFVNQGITIDERNLLREIETLPANESSCEENF